MDQKTSKLYSLRPPSQVNQKLQLLQAGKIVDDTPSEQRSPSPEPVYSEAGVRINTREQRFKEKLTRERSVGGRVRV